MTDLLDSIYKGSLHWLGFDICTSSWISIQYLPLAIKMSIFQPSVGLHVHLTQHVPFIWFSPNGLQWYIRNYLNKEYCIYFQRLCSNRWVQTDCDFGKRTHRDAIKSQEGHRIDHMTPPSLCSSNYVWCGSVFNKGYWMEAHIYPSTLQQSITSQYGSGPSDTQHWQSIR